MMVAELYMNKLCGPHGHASFSAADLLGKAQIRTAQRSALRLSA
jgi:hypothetical protein